MGTFEFWVKWGIELNDEQFANAFTALGILSANCSCTRDKSLSEPSQFTDNVESEFYKIELKMAIFNAISRSRQEESAVPWSYPLHDQYVKIGQGQITLSRLNPLGIAQEWEFLTKKPEIPEPRFCIISYPSTEPVRPWFRLLFEATPQKNTAYIKTEVPQAQLCLKWPLRLGYLPGNAAEESVKNARFWWPANDLTSTVRIDRENANCDVLLFSGSSNQLLDTLQETPVPQKTNLFIVRGTFEDDLTTISHRLSSIATEGHASGFIFLNPAVTDEVLGRAVNRFVENLSHNQPVDIAASEAFTKSYPTDPVIYLSRDLATFQLEHVLDKMYAQLINLPKTARTQIESDFFLRMGMPVDSTTDDLTNPIIAAEKLKKHKGSIIFLREDTGASGIAKINEAIKHAENQATEEKKQKRFLQEQIFIKKEGKFIEEHRAFQSGVPTLMRVRIGLPDKKWHAIDAAFSEEKLPQDRDEWQLTVVLTEPNHLKAALRQSIKLPRFGPSTECEFLFHPEDFSLFEGRITVLHRGRVLQTGVIKGRVVSEERNISKDDTISFADVLAVRSNISDLEGRRQFDLAFVMNHTTDDRPLLTAISSDHAWLADISACQQITMDINSELTNVAISVKDYSGGLTSDENVQLLVKLAQIGRQLYGKIVLGQISQPGNQAKFKNLEYIQIVSTKTDALMPLEFIYSAVAPNNDAKLCPNMADVVMNNNGDIRLIKARALIERTCQKANRSEEDKGYEECQYRTTEFVCPMGFWGTSKVIERHMVTPLLAQPGKDFFLQSEVTTANRGELQITGTAIVGASEKVKPKMLSPLISACKVRLESPPQEAKDWSDWVKLIKEHKPHVLLALPHTNGNGANATLEINGKTLSSGQITEAHVHAADEKTYPLVALLGCDTTGTALDYGEYVNWFRWQGAAIVISTIAKVFGGHAAAVAEQLIRGLNKGTNQQERIGEIIRDIKQQSLLDGSLMALCIVAFGDADWKITSKEDQ